jgi:hypothetical protein
MPDGEKKDQIVQTIANHMKKLYLTWNRDVVSDELILKDLTELSKGKIKIPEDIKLSDSREIMSRNKRRRMRKTTS